MYLFQHAKVDMQSEFGLQLIGEQTQGSIDVAATLYPTSGPGVIIPAQYAAFHASWYLKKS